MKKNLFLFGFIAFFLLVAVPSVFASDPSYQIGGGPFNDEIVVSQGVTAELSFGIADTVLAMSGTIPGLTGGTATANTNFNVITNNATGYKVELSMANSGTMVGPTINSVAYDIDAYAGTQGGSWSVAANKSAFGYSTTSTTWWAGTGSNVVIKTSPYPTLWDAATTTNTLYFKVEITANPNALVAEGTYYATTTLTATML